MAVNKKDLTEAEIRTRFITPAIKDITGWDVNNIRDEFPIDAGQSYPSGPKGKRGKKRFADYVLAAQILGWESTEVMKKRYGKMPNDEKTIGLREAMGLPVVKERREFLF